jgi:hypothetical protein
MSVCKHVCCLSIMTKFDADILLNSYNLDAGYPVRQLSGSALPFVENRIKLTCPEIDGYHIKYSTVIWLMELQIRRGRKYETQVLVSLALQPSAGYGLLVPRGFLITHNDAQQSVGLLWTSDQLVTETST